MSHLFSLVIGATLHNTDKLLQADVEEESFSDDSYDDPCDLPVPPPPITMLSPSSAASDTLDSEEIGHLLDELAVACASPHLQSNHSMLSSPATRGDASSVDRYNSIMAIAKACIQQCAERKDYLVDLEKVMIGVYTMMNSRREHQSTTSVFNAGGISAGTTAIPKHGKSNSSRQKPFYESKRKGSNKSKQKRMGVKRKKSATTNTATKENGKTNSKESHTRNLKKGGKELGQTSTKKRGRVATGMDTTNRASICYGERNVKRARLEDKIPTLPSGSIMNVTEDATITSTWDLVADTSIPDIGFENLGNTCYMNACLQGKSTKCITPITHDCC